MRWVVAHPGPSFSVQDVYTGWVEALQGLGQQVVGYNLDDRLTFYSAAMLPDGEQGAYRPATDVEGARRLAVDGLFSTLYRVRPDVLMVVSGFFVPPELYQTARAHGTRIVVVHTESPYEDVRQAGVGQYADVNLLNDPTNVGMFPGGRYMPHAYRPTLHHPGPPSPELVCDLAFVGTGYQSRMAFLQAMDLTGLDVLLAGEWSAAAVTPLQRFVATPPDECLDNDQTVRVYQSARVGLNLYRREAERPELSQGWALGPREVEMAACGLFFLRDPRGEGDEVLSMLPTFSSPEEAGDRLRWWLGHEDERVEVARKAREAIADRTFTRHAVDLLRLLEQ